MKRSLGIPHSPSWNDFSCLSKSHTGGLACRGSGKVAARKGWHPQQALGWGWPSRGPALRRAQLRRKKPPRATAASVTFHEEGQTPIKPGGSGLSKDGARLFACCNLQAAAFRALSPRVRPWTYVSVKL